MSSLSNAWNRYLRYTDVHPIKVQGLTAFIFASLGNLLSQVLVERRPINNIDWPSMMRFTGIAVCISFPIVRTWLWVLETYVKPGKFAPLRRVLLDQLLFAPINYAFFMYIIGLIEGGSFKEAKQRVQNDWWNVLMSNYKLWPAVQLINFYLVPFNQRILFSSVVSLFWNTYLAYVVRMGGNTTETPHILKKE